jgi:hypothetical protein
MMYDGAGQKVDLQSAAKAVNCFAELWGSGEFDCGPQNYKFMTEEILDLIDDRRDLPEVRRRLNEPTIPLSEIDKTK